jgi:hypothetical protein
MNKDKDFAPYQPSLDMKELGFDEPCFGYYYTLDGKDWKFADDKQYDSLDEFYNIGSKFTISAPLYQQAFRWFREKYNLHSEIRSYTAKFFTPVIQKLESIVTYIEYGGVNSKYATYEEAELACLNKLIEIVKNK